MTGRVITMIATVAGFALGDRLAAQARPGFDHAAHSRLFPTCVTCHVGASRAGAPIYPAPAACASCHDGAIEERVTWTPPAGPRVTNLRFDHAAHRSAVAQRPGAEAACVTCHAEQGAPWMRVRIAAVERCVECHEIRVAHLAAPDSACAVCHVPLADATELPRERIARFPAPESHRDPRFRGAAHGAAARVGPAVAGAPVAAGCATCHARDFCVTCHVDAPEQAIIQALRPDPRSTAIAAELAAPSSHAEPGFLSAHGRDFAARPQACSTCHTRESCLACHAAAPKGAVALFAAGPGRGPGAIIARRAPPSHGGNFADRHGADASAGPASCAACHVQPDCLSCHRPDAGAAPGYHPAGFLARHPAAAYSRETACSECHNTGGFCASCHASAGVVANRTLRGGYHDAKQFFLAGHGQAARQNLESCVSCHAERDCLTCHGATGGRRFNPHGPGFDANRLRKKNPEMCTACHGIAIPTR